MAASADGSRLMTEVARCVPGGGFSDGPPDSRQMRMCRPPGPAVAMTLSQADGTQPSSNKKVTVSSPSVEPGVAIMAGYGGPAPPALQW